MRFLPRRVYLLLLFSFFLFPFSLLAHPVPRRSHDRLIAVQLTAEALIVHYRLEVDPFTVVYDDLPAVDDLVDLKKLTRPSDFYEAFTRCYAPILAERLRVELDGRALTLECVQRGHRLVDDDGKPLDHLRCDFEFRTAWQPGSGDHSLSFRDGTYEEETGRIQSTLRGAAPVVLVRHTLPGPELQGKPVQDLKRDDEARLRRLTATFRVATATAASGERVPGASPPVEASNSGHTPSARQPEIPGHHNLLDLLLDPQRGLWVLLLLAMGFGAAHALTPGHGKTLVAAYLVGERGSIRHAFILGLVTTLTHTGSVLLLAALLLFFFPDAVPEHVQTVLGVVGGLLVAGLGFWLLLRRLAGGHDHIHLGGHPHDHSHSALGAEQSALNWWGLIVLGISGGIVPCWDAIIMLGFAISAQRLWLALPLLLAFSAGLAGVLIAIGIAVVSIKGFSGSRWGESRLFRALPLISALLVTILGLWLCYDSIHRESSTPPAPLSTR